LTDSEILTGNNFSSITIGVAIYMMLSNITDISFKPKKIQ
jgi:hypothetical protein